MYKKQEARSSLFLPAPAILYKEFKRPLTYQPSLVSEVKPKPNNPIRDHGRKRKKSISVCLQAQLIRIGKVNSWAWAVSIFIKFVIF